uniref:Putative DNA repair protein XRCC1 n=1 Tax=Reticulitermes speratus TaxID=60591 RepID=A0A2Z5TS20_9NEOP
MPEIKLTAVKGYNSQDEKHPAENLLNGNVNGRKWLISASRTVTSMAATFQLAECCIISSVHIGNSGSAFVSLLVSRTGCSEFKDLLPCSALMTMQESKTGQSKNCVKIYNKDDFLEETKGARWDQIRVVVTQPFNLQMQFGLSFLRVFSFVEEETADTKINSDSFAEWKKMRYQINNPLCPLSSKLVGRQLSGSSPLCHSDKLLLQTGQKSNELHELDEKGRTSSRTKNENIDKDFFEVSVLSFIESLNLQDKNLDNIQLMELREELEQVQGRELSPHERRIFIAVVKKYLMSLKCKTFSNTKSTQFNQSTETEHCSSEEFLKTRELTASVNMPHHSNTVKTDQMSMKKCDGNNRGDGTGWLCTEGDYYSAQASTSKTSSHVMKSPSVRRNLISLKDCDYTHKNVPFMRKVSDNLVDGDKSLNGNSDGESECGIQSNKNKMLKRKSSEVDGSIKKYHAVNSDILDITDSCGVTEIQDISPASRQSTEESLVQCPVCGGYFGADVVERHSWECVSFPENDIAEDCIIQEVTCPVCSKTMSSAIVDIHANMCASEKFGE